MLFGKGTAWQGQQCQQAKEKQEAQVACHCFLQLSTLTGSLFYICRGSAMIILQAIDTCLVPW